MTTVRLPKSALETYGACVPFHARVAAVAIDGFVVRHETGWLAFRNRCPHWHVDLDLGAGAPYDPALGLIFCRNHGALFRSSDGLCIRGPCNGLYLDTFPVHADGDDVVVVLAGTP